MPLSDSVALKENRLIQQAQSTSQLIYKQLIYKLDDKPPFIEAAIVTIPQPVLGGATIVMFGTIAVAGIDIIASTKVDRRTLIIVAASLALYQILQ